MDACVPWMVSIEWFPKVTVVGLDDSYQASKLPRPWVRVHTSPVTIMLDPAHDGSFQGLLTIIRKNRLKEKEMRVLFLWVFASQQTRLQQIQERRLIQSLTGTSED